MTIPIPKHTSIFARKKARRLALQGIYQWDMTQAPQDEIEHWLIENYSSKRLDLSYLREVLSNVPLHKTDLDQTFTPFLDRPIEQLERVELAILRIATYELLYLPDIPYRVIINEALELSKSFGSIEGFKYVNGVLDKVAKKVRKEALPSEKSKT